MVGFNRAELARVLSLAPRTETTVDAGSLLARYERVFGAFLRASRQVPDARLDWRSPERDRTLRAFIYHVLDRPALVLGARKTGAYRYEDILASYEKARSRPTSAALVAYGEEVLGRIRDYLGEASEADLGLRVDSYQGALAVRDLLSLALGHTAHHLKQLYHYLGLLGLVPESPLAAEDLTGIEMPSALF